ALMIEPATWAGTSGDTTAYMATAKDTAGNTWTVTAAFSSDDPWGTWTGSMYTAGMVGTWTVRGTDTATGLSGTATVVVLHGTATGLMIEPAWGTITSGATISYTAAACDTVGNVWSVTTAFSCDDPLGTWTGSVYTASMVGTWTITGIYIDLYAFATVIVLPKLPAAISISPIPDQICHQPFNLTIMTLNKQGSLLPYSGAITIFDLTGTITPNVIEIRDGVWTGDIRINKSRLNNQISCEIAGLKYPGGASNLFDVLIDNASDEKIVDENVVLEIQANSVDEDYCLEINHEPSGWEINNANHQAGTASVLEDTLCEIKITDASNRELTFPQPSIAISLVYQPEDLGNIDPKTLQICRLQNGQWIPVHGRVYPNAKRVTALIDKPGIFVLKGVAFGNSPLDVIVYPNPCKGKEIIFRHTNDYTIEIYDLAGDLLKRQHVQGAEYRWGTRDDYGRLLDSGAYIYVIIGKKESIRGKVVIIR
ncbi:MAG: T9SS type A sorting domain-containing protein, partial [bacterium]|nr:T9SS type A sorting domain-containing protein [bacterium]